MRKLLTLLASCAMLALPSALHADTIMNGQFTIQGMLTDTGTTLDFSSAAVGVGTQTGTFATLITDGEGISGTSAVLSYVSYVPGSEMFFIGPLTIDIETFAETGAGTFSGTALLSAAGFSNAMADIVLTTDSVKGGPVHFSAVTDVPSSVPEPSTLALFGSGVLGLAGIVRRKVFRA